MHAPFTTSCNTPNQCTHKPQALLNEITSYEANIQEVEKTTKELVASDHFASDTIEQQNSELQHLWRQLKLLAAKRTQKLNDALEAQKVSKLTQCKSNVTIF